jgi:hypothetical protein
MHTMSNSTTKPYTRTLHIGILFSIFIIFIGMKCLLIVLLDQVGCLQSLTSQFGIVLVNLSFMKGFYTGFGCALIVVGAAMIIRNALLPRNGEKFRKAEINYLDERNRFIKSATLNTTSYVFMIVLAFAIVISGMFNSVVFVTLLGAFIVYLMILLISYLICRVQN